MNVFRYILSLYNNLVKSFSSDDVPANKKVNTMIMKKSKYEVYKINKAKKKRLRKCLSRKKDEERTAKRFLSGKAFDEKFMEIQAKYKACL